jgi:hypothetical protein
MIGEVGNFGPLAKTDIHGHWYQVGMDVCRAQSTERSLSCRTDEDMIVCSCRMIVIVGVA